MKRGKNHSIDNNENFDMPVSAEQQKKNLLVKKQSSAQRRQISESHQTLVVRNQINIINNQHSQQIFSKGGSSGSVGSMTGISGLIES